MPPRRRAKAAAASSSNAVAAPSPLANMLGRTEELTALFETLGVLSCALMACLSRGWRTAMNEARAQITSVEVLDYSWFCRQKKLWAKRHHERIEYFHENFAMSVLPRFYTGLRKLRLGYLHDHTASRPSVEVDHRFPAVDEALAQVTSRLSQLRELDVGPGMSNLPGPGPSSTHGQHYAHVRVRL